MIADFILARVAEDEEAARLPDSKWVKPYEESLRWHPSEEVLDMLVIDTARVLRQCEAIRRIVPIADAQSKWDALGSATDEDGWAILEALAAIWSDHPDHGGWWAA